MCRGPCFIRNAQLGHWSLEGDQSGYGINKLLLNKKYIHELIKKKRVRSGI